MSYHLTGPQRQWLRAGLGTGFPEPTWTQQAPQPRSPLLRGGFLRAAELQTLGLLRSQVRGEEAPGPCFRSPWQRGLECHSGSPLPRHIRTPSSAASSQCTHSKGGTPEENNHSLLPFTIAFPPYKREKRKKEKTTACLKETAGSFWCNLGATILGSGFPLQRFVRLL